MATTVRRWRTSLFLCLLALGSLANAQGDKSPEEVITASDATPAAVSTEVPLTENESSAASEVEKQVHSPEDTLPAEPSPFPEITTTAAPKN